MISAVEFCNVTKIYNNIVPIKNLNLSLKKGRSYAIMGPSGCGKTTLLRLLMGLEKPDEGFIKTFGAISTVFQEDRLIENMTAYGNLKCIFGKEKKNQIKKMITSLELGKDLNKTVFFFSGGMKRRLAIARALIANYDILILDEPFKGLDKHLKEKTADIIHHHSNTKTILLVSHDIEDATMLNCEVINHIW